LFVAGNHLAGKDGPRFSVVRYGNVIGSRGSVIPFFKERAKVGKLPITDPRMTRFWIKIDEGANFVDRCLHLMRGGEIFIPKIPSMRLTDLASAIGPDCEQETIGIRPGEKLHELLITRDDARHTLEFEDLYIIQPGIHRWDYVDSAVYGGERGKPVMADFEYASDSNTEWLDLKQLKAVI
jgi:UDP-N-acetylglucosamine 4,6-dehydratase